MGKWLHDHRVFWRQFRAQFHTTGAVLPSGRFLGRALARFVGQEPRGQRILEVGPGTGAVTAQIVRRLGPHDALDLVELNTEFVARLNERFAADEPFRKVAVAVARAASRRRGSRAARRLLGLRPGDLRPAAEQLRRGRRGADSRRDEASAAARRHAVVLRVHRHSQGQNDRQLAGRTRAAARHQPSARRACSARTNSSAIGSGPIFRRLGCTMCRLPAEVVASAPKADSQ